MCGIAGAVGHEATTSVPAVEAMCAKMIRRGPDDGGLEVVSAEDPVVVLGSHRLAIIDPSPDGDQPMSDPVRGTTIVFNGMISNFARLRAELESRGERFRSRCDTEIVLRAYGRYGRSCVGHFRGMFAFAVWDARDGTLFLARDRLGVKPLYYYVRGDELLFASQVKALLATGLVPFTLSRAALRTYLSFGAVSEPLTAVEGVRALPAGHTALLRDGRLELQQYWAPPREPASSPVSRELAVEELRRRLEEIVAQHLVSDVPIGVLLSGGLDSSFLAALAARAVDGVCTISIGLDDPDFSDAGYGDLVAAHIGSSHTSLTLDAASLRASLDGAFEAMDQPTFDGVNTYVVAGATREAGLTVAVSGLGADELFDGYDHVRRTALLERARALPAPAQNAAQLALGGLAGGARLEKALAWLTDEHGCGSSYELLRRLFLPEDVSRLLGATPPEEMQGIGALDPGQDLAVQLSILDLTNYLKNVLLRDTDAMSRAHSIEVRVPYLDHTLLEWVLGLPAEVKGARKELLRVAARDLLPEATLARTRHGFLLPLHRWMRTELRQELEETLRWPPTALVAALDSSAIAKVWAAYSRDNRRWLPAWALFALCRWTETIEALVSAREPIGTR
ncbi:MAG TPA: asparagine synthase (glutamine-hydrolyzing) [Gaiellaceae bacterium]|nr:asparagine synthase (glutamine-hydrolyzing) [Gaiellaceae bacterium]